MDINDLFLGKIILDDMNNMDRMIQQGLRESEEQERRAEQSRRNRLKMERELSKLENAHEQKLALVKDENARLNAELEVMRKVVANRNAVIQAAKKNLNEFQNFAVVIQEKLDKERKEKEIIKNMLLNANILELAEMNGTIKEDMAGERALLHKWMLSRNSFWELAYRLAKEQGLDITMDELKEKADLIKAELVESGFSAPEFKNEDNKEISDLTSEENNLTVIDAEIKNLKELKKLKGEMTMDEKMEIIRIDSEMNLLKKGFDPQLPLEQQIKK